MPITTEDLIVEFVKQGGPDDVCFSSPEGNGWTKPHGRNARKPQICIEYRKRNPYISITDDMRKKLLGTLPLSHGIVARRKGNVGTFSYKIDLATVPCSADKLVKDLIAAAKVCGGW